MGTECLTLKRERLGIPFHTICGKLCGDRLAALHNFLSCNTSSKLHSPAALPDSLFDQSLACMKQRVEGNEDFSKVFPLVP